jgi:hypothetical protein
VLEAAFVLLEFSSPSRRIFIGSHSLPPLWFAVSVLQRGALPCRPVVRPQGVRVAPSSPSCMRSPEPQVVGEALADDVRTATPPRGTVDGVVTSPPVDDMRVDSPPRAAESVETSARDVRVTTFPTIIDVDPIRKVHCGAEDHVGDQPRIDLALGGPETSGAQVPPSSFSCPWLPG